MPRPCLTRAIALSFLALLPLAAHAEKPRKPRPALPAAQYPLHDTHPQEHVTVAAEPGDTKETAPDTRLDYFRHGFMPVRVIVSNDSDQALTLDDARILFISPETTLPENAASDEELQRRMFALKSVAGHKIPLPAPLPSITVHGKPVDKKILADDNDFGFPGTTVAPHTTASGYLFYDVRDLDEPVLKGATLELRKARWSATNKQLEAFEIPLQPAVSSPNSVSNAAKP